MLVKLNAADQFGENGPGLNDIGELIDINHVPDEDDWMALVWFFEYDEDFGGQRRAYFWCNLKHLLWPDTSGTTTVFSASKAWVKEVQPS